jgi:hypothetical protein
MHAETVFRSNFAMTEEVPCCAPTQVWSRYVTSLLNLQPLVGYGYHE